MTSLPNSRWHRWCWREGSFLVTGPSDWLCPFLSHLKISGMNNKLWEIFKVFLSNLHFCAKTWRSQNEFLTIGTAMSLGENLLSLWLIYWTKTNQQLKFGLPSSVTVLTIWSFWKPDSSRVSTDPKFTPKSGAVIITLGWLTSRQLLSKLLETVESNLYGYLSLLCNLAWQAFYTLS